MVRGDVFALDPELRRQLDAVLAPSSDLSKLEGRGKASGDDDLERKGDGGGAMRSYSAELGVEVDDGERKIWTMADHLWDCVEKDRGRPSQSIEELTLEAQELVIADDVLDTLLGSPGELCRVKVSHRDKDIENCWFVFHIDRGCGAVQSICDLADQILEVVSEYVRVYHFVERAERSDSGLLLQGLGAAVRELVREYSVTVCQFDKALRTGRLTLQRLLFAMRPLQKSMKTLRKVAEAVGKKKGTAAFIAVEKLWRRDEEGKAIIGFLLTRCAPSVLDFVSRWMFLGVIEDGGLHFFLEERKELRREIVNRDLNSSYWEQRYRVQNDAVPQFLSKYVNKILLAGKYINVLRECDEELIPENPVDPFWRKEFNFDSPATEWTIANYIDVAFESASSTLVAHVMKEADLLGRLKSLKRYFLLDHGDFLTHFFDVASEELVKKASQASVTKLASLLELSIRTSSSSADVYKDDLTCSLQSTSVADQLLRIVNVADSSDHALKSSKSKELRAFEGFTVDYKVDWPLCLIISRKAITKYQLIFRHLFHCKHVERTLGSSWKTQQGLKYLDSKLVYAKSFALFARMLNFVQSFLYYMEIEVIEPASHRLVTRLKTVQSVDDMMFYHNDFLDTCVKDCALMNSKLLQIITNLMSVCLLFANYTERFARNAIEHRYDDDIDQINGSETRGESLNREELLLVKLQDDAVANRFDETVEKFEQNFHAHLRQLLQELGTASLGESEPHLASLESKLDFNGFYDTWMSRSR